MISDDKCELDLRRYSRGKTRCAAASPPCGLGTTHRCSPHQHTPGPLLYRYKARPSDATSSSMPRHTDRRTAHTHMHTHCSEATDAVSRAGWGEHWPGRHPRLDQHRDSPREATMCVMRDGATVDTCYHHRNISDKPQSSYLVYIYSYIYIYMYV